MIHEIEIPQNIQIESLRLMVSEGQVNSKCRKGFIFGDFDKINNQNLTCLSRTSHQVRRVFFKDSKMFASIVLFSTLHGKQLKSNMSDYKFVLRLNDTNTEFVTIDALPR